MDTEQLDDDIKPLMARRFSRRQALRQSGAGLAAAGLAAAGVTRASAQGTPAAVSGDLAAAFDTILADPRFRPSRLGLHVTDRATGDVIFDIRSDEWFLAGSTTKLWAGSAALDALGADYRFETPVYRTGPIETDGTLDGDLILVASGDLTMGGRDTPDSRIAYPTIDHTYAYIFPDKVELTSQDPLAGLDELAKQVADAGVTRITGEVIIDDRLFPATPKDNYILTPIWINDNLVDLKLTPGQAGDPAALEWRPRTAAYSVEADVRTVAAGELANVSVISPGPGRIAISGQIPSDLPQYVAAYQVENPADFARTLLIEALTRAGVTVAAAAWTGPNPVDRLPASDSYADAGRVALRRSLPFSENLKLIWKCSHNQHADMLVMHLALKRGSTDFAGGMQGIGAFLQVAGIDPGTLSLGDGRGNTFSDLFSPRTVVRLLAYLTTRPDFATAYAALPGLGVDGAEVVTVPPTSPIVGKAFAKSGTSVDYDAMNQRTLLMARELAGYMTGKSGREVIFAVYLNNVPLDGTDLFTVINTHGELVEAIFAHC
jgi:D-alanyl-D-alanine carboxypeptidase/D-alanyl-D-alanine-endopeptidase (penicillin-binding protein 4)